MPNDPEQRRLRTVNIIAILTALESIATGGYRGANPATYESLPVNAGAAVDLVITGARLVLPGEAPMLGDISMNYLDALLKGRLRVQEVGDLGAVTAPDIINANGLYLHPALRMLTEQKGQRWLRLNAQVELAIRRGPEASSALVREVGAH